MFYALCRNSNYIRTGADSKHPLQCPSPHGEVEVTINLYKAGGILRR